jgi:folate-binding protein YgfZ
MSIILLSNQSLVSIEGQDNFHFIQGLITNDIELARERLIYSAMLNSTGRFFCDFFIFSQPSKKFNNEGLSDIFIDVNKANLENLIAKLKSYILRQKIEIKDNWQILVLQILPPIHDFAKTQLTQNISKEDKPLDLENISCDIEKSSQLLLEFCRKKNIEVQINKDPRCYSMGKRAYLFLPDNDKDQLMADLKPLLHKDDNALYHYQRIMSLIPEGYEDLKQEKSIINNYNFDSLQAISYNKGCYIGQELVARTHNLGVVRKILIAGELAVKSNDLPEFLAVNNGESLQKHWKNLPIYQQLNYGNMPSKVEIGKTLSVVVFNGNIYLLMLLEIPLNLIDNNVEKNLALNIANNNFRNDLSESSITIADLPIKIIQ